MVSLYNELPEFGDVRGVFWGPLARGLLGALLGRPGVLLGRFGAILRRIGASWGLSWGPFAVSGISEAVLDAVETGNAKMPTSFRNLKRMPTMFASQEPLGSSLGPLLECLGGFQGSIEAFLGCI